MPDHYILFLMTDTSTDVPIKCQLVFFSFPLGEVQLGGGAAIQYRRAHFKKQGRKILKTRNYPHTTLPMYLSISSHIGAHFEFPASCLPSLGIHLPDWQSKTVEEPNEKNKRCRR